MPKNSVGIVYDTTRLRKTGHSLSLIVPKCVRTVLDWAEDELLLIRAEHNRVLIVPTRAALIAGGESNAGTNNQAD